MSILSELDNFHAKKKKISQLILIVTSNSCTSYFNTATAVNYLWKDDCIIALRPKKGFISASGFLASTDTTVE